MLTLTLFAGWRSLRSHFSKAINFRNGWCSEFELSKNSIFAIFQHYSNSLHVALKCIILIIVDWIIFHVLGRDMISWTETSPQFWHWIKSAKFHSGKFVSSKPSENAVKWNICAQYVKRQHICSAKCIWMHGFIPVLAFYVI